MQRNENIKTVNELAQVGPAYKHYWYLQHIDLYNILVISTVNEVAQVV